MNPTEEWERMDDAICDLLMRARTTKPITARAMERLRANNDAPFKAAVEPMGFFSFVRLLDAVVDSVIDEENATEPLKVELDRLQSVIDDHECEIARLQKWKTGVVSAVSS